MERRRANGQSGARKAVQAVQDPGERLRDAPAAGGAPRTTRRRCLRLESTGSRAARYAVGRKHRFRECSFAKFFFLGPYISQIQCLDSFYTAQAAMQPATQPVA